jgi:hypothetical protein
MFIELHHHGGSSLWVFDQFSLELNAFFSVSGVHDVSKHHLGIESINDCWSWAMVFSITESVVSFDDESVVGQSISLYIWIPFCLLSRLMQMLKILA